MARHVLPVHHADRRRDVVMPYAPALLVRRGSLLFLSGVTAAPVYHSHPHRDEEFDLPATMREQAELAMENLKKTLRAAGCDLGDIVSATRYLTDVAEQDDLNRVWAAHLGDHLPTTTTVEVSRLATHARCKIEISAIAVADSEAKPSGRRRDRAKTGQTGATRRQQSDGAARGDSSARPAAATASRRRPATGPKRSSRSQRTGRARPSPTGGPTRGRRTGRLSRRAAR